MQQTSIKTYHDEILPTLGARQEAVLKQFADTDHGFTNSELAMRLGWPINTVTPRVYELRRLKVLEECCKRACRVTGRRVICWKIKLPEPEQLTLNALG